MELTGKTALVTGASRGIGKSIARKLAANGAVVGVHYGSNDAAARQTVLEIEESGGEAFPVHAELGVDGDIDTLFAALNRNLPEGGLDILVNNAARVSMSTLDDLDIEPEEHPGVVDATALGRIGQPEDIADVVEFLASPAARWITGQVIDATGGMFLRLSV